MTTEGMSLILEMISRQHIDIEIDKLTRSIENAITGDSFKTAILPLATKDLKLLTKSDWFFDWEAEAKNKEKSIYKLTIIENPNVLQGLISLQDKDDHIFMHLIENSKFNRGVRKVYIGVSGNLVAYACKLSFQKGYGGYISFENKTRLIEQYRQTLGSGVIIW